MRIDRLQFSKESRPVLVLKTAWINEGQILWPTIAVPLRCKSEKCYGSSEYCMYQITTSYVNNKQISGDIVAMLTFASRALCLDLYVSK